MKKLLLSFFASVLCTLLAAQVTPPAGPILMEVQRPVDTVHKDSVLPTFERGYANVYVLASSSFNIGQVAPLPLPPQTLLSTNYSYYSSVSPEKSNFGYAFGIEYETKEILHRFYIGIGGELQKFSYSGSATEVSVYKGGSVYDSATQKVNYSWSASYVSIPIRIHVMAYQNSKFRFDAAFGVSVGLVSQSNSGDQSAQNDDAFSRTYVFGIFGIGAEYNFMREDLLRFEPCYYYGLTTSPAGRKLGSFGIRIGFMFD
jgi:hypothetical protein